jgi:hypothetical protein
LRIRRQDADALATYIANLQSTIASAFDDVQAAEDALANLASFRSDARDACVAYFNEVDKTMRDAITSALQDISDTYSNLFLGQFPDDAAYGDFDEDELYRIAMDFRSYGKKAHDIRKGINNIIGRAEGVVNSNFHGIGSDIAPDISDGFCECADAADGIRQSIDQLDKAQAANVSRVQQHVDDVADLIHGYMNDSTMQCDTYTAGSLQNNTAYAAVMVDNASTEDYHEQNAAAIANEQAALQDRIAVRAQIQELDTEGSIEMATALIGASATIATISACIAATPETGGISDAAAAASAAGSLGSVAEDISDAFEGSDMIDKAEIGDVSDPAYNPIRDSLFGGNQITYDISKPVVDFISMGPFAFIKDGVRGLVDEGAKQAAEAAVSDAASGAANGISGSDSTGDEAGDVTGSASDAFNLISEIAKGMKR